MDLSKVENRKQYIKDCEEGLIEELRGVDVLISEKAVCWIRRNTIEIGVNYENRKGYSFDFASEFRVYMEDKPRFAVGSTGSFDPTKPKEAPNYWRIVHSGEILKNWLKVIPIFRKYSDMVNKLYDIPVIK